MLYFERGSPTDTLSNDDLRAGLNTALAKIGVRKRVLVIPPDFTRFHSRAGTLTRLAYDALGANLTDILPALGTHSPMTSEQIHEMFPGVPESLFRVHNWRTGITTVGTVPAEFVKEVSEGAVDFPWPAQQRGRPLARWPANAAFLRHGSFHFASSPIARKHCPRKPRRATQASI